MSKQSSTTPAPAAATQSPQEILAKPAGAAGVAKAASLKIYAVLAQGLETLRAAAFKVRELKDSAPVEAGEAAVDVVRKAQAAAKLAGQHYREQVESLTARVSEIKGVWMPLHEGFQAVERDMKALADEVLTALRQEHARQERDAEERRVEAERQQKAAEARARAAATPEEEIAASVEAAEHYTDAREAKDSAPKGPPPNVLRSSTGASLHGRERWDFEIEDLTKVPDEYTHRVVNSEAVVKAIAGGARARSIPGLRIFPTATIARGAPRK